LVKKKLEIENLSARHPGLTQPLADSYTEAARVCLDRHHESPQIFSLNNEKEILDAEVEWIKTTDKIRAAWANEIDTTEAGAYAVAIAAVEISESLFAVRRAETGTGADYYIASEKSNINDLEKAIRLEVSGIDVANEVMVNYRLNQKVKQAKLGNSNLPAMATVVGFQPKIIKLKKID